MSEHPPDTAPISTVAEPPRIVERVNEHARPKPAATSIVLGLTRVGGCLAPVPPEPEPALSFDGQLNLRGVSKVRADARSPLAVVAVVLIVLFIVAGVVLVARGGTQREEFRREDLGRCTERIQRTEFIERTCVRDGS